MSDKTEEKNTEEREKVPQEEQTVQATLCKDQNQVNTSQESTMHMPGCVEDSKNEILGELDQTVTEELESNEVVDHPVDSTHQETGKSTVETPKSDQIAPEDTTLQPDLSEEPQVVQIDQEPVDLQSTSAQLESPMAAVSSSHRAVVQESESQIVQRDSMFTLTRLGPEDLDDDVHHRQEDPRNPQIDVQDQQLVSQRRVKLVRRIIITNDMVGRLFADIERVFRFLGHRVNDQYRDYILNPDLDLPCVLDNIAGYLSGIDIVGRSDEQRIDIPVDEEELKLWIQTLDDIKKTPENETALKILAHALKCIRDRKVEQVPEALQDSIFEVDSGQIVADLTQNGQFDIVCMNAITQGVADNTEEMLQSLQDMDPEEIQLTKKPLLEYKLQDIQRFDARRRRPDDEMDDGFL
jgi:hypothetical protein